MKADLKVFVTGTRGFPGIQGGVEKHCQELYPRLVGYGCKVTVATRTPYVPRGKRMREWQGVSLVNIWCPRRKSLEAIIHTFLAVLAAAWRSADIVHIHAVGPALLTPLARLMGMEVVLTTQGSDYERAKWGRFAKMAIKAGEFLGTKLSDRVIVVSTQIREQLETRYGRKDLTLIPNGVTLPDIVPPGETLRRLGLEEKKYVFTATRLVPEKGLHDLLGAYAMLRDPGFKLVIGGAADHETPYSRELVRTAREIPGVVMAGFVTGAPLGELYSNAGLFALASYHEGLSLALLEAMGYNLPVLVSDITPNKEVPLPEYRYFPVGNVEVLSRKLAERFHAGIDEKEKDEQRRILETLFSWDTIAARTYEVYREIMNKTKRHL